MAHIENTAMFTFLYNRRDRFSYYNSVIVEFIIYNIDYYIGIKILYAYYNRYYIRYQILDRYYYMDVYYYMCEYVI